MTRHRNTEAWFFLTLFFLVVLFFFYLIGFDHGNIHEERVTNAYLTLLFVQGMESNREFSIPGIAGIKFYPSKGRTITIKKCQEE